MYSVVSNANKRKHKSLEVNNHVSNANKSNESEKTSPSLSLNNAKKRIKLEKEEETNVVNKDAE